MLGSQLFVTLKLSMFIVSKPYRYARKKWSYESFKEIELEFQNLIGMLGSKLFSIRFSYNIIVSKPYRYARKLA